MILEETLLYLPIISHRVCGLLCLDVLLGSGISIGGLESVFFFCSKIQSIHIYIYAPRNPLTSAQLWSQIGAIR